MPSRGNVFRTKPDLIVRKGGEVLVAIDTKWKCLSADPLDRKHGVARSDVYQLMAYARLYRCERLILLYPSSHNQLGRRVHVHGIAQGTERRDIVTLSIAPDNESVRRSLLEMMSLDPQPIQMVGAFLGAFQASLRFKRENSVT